MTTPALMARLNAGLRILPKHMLMEVEYVLSHAARGKGRSPRFMTAYQILERLEQPLRAQLDQQYGGSGMGAGHYFGAATSVAQAAAMLEKRGSVHIEYIDTAGIETGRPGKTIKPGYSVCGIYQIV